MKTRFPYEPSVEMMIEYFELRSFAASMSPEEYVARQSHTHYLAGPFGYHHPEAQLDAWMGCVGEMLGESAIIANLRRRYLTPTEVAEVEAAENEEL